jgi:hypothetical protein
LAVDNLSDLGTTEADTNMNYFVVSRDLANLTELQERQLNKAHELLEQHNAKVGVTSAKNVMKITTKLAGLSYIIPDFDGELYEHLVKHNARIYGPLSIIQSIEKNVKIPKSPKPLLAMYCANFNATVTGLDFEERTSVFEKIDALGGVSSGTMTARTTHLFAHTCDPKSEKYQRAIKENKLIVSPAWLDFVLETTKNEELCSFVPYGTFKIKVLTGCVITSSKFDSDQNLKISKLVRQHGGQFSGTMAQQTCTHLVIDSIIGEKYQKAKEWKTVKIVTLKWLMQCAETGIRYDEDNYQPDVIPSTKMLVQDDNLFDAADPSLHLSNQNLYQVENVQEKNILQSKNGNNEMQAEEEEATVPQDNEDKSEKENVEPMAIDEPAFEDDQQDVFAENENSNEIPMPQYQQHKITKVKPQRRRMFGLEEESEDGTDVSEPYQSGAAVLAGVRPKPRRRLPAPEPETDADDSNQTAEGEPIAIDEPVFEDDQPAVAAENQKSNQVESVKETPEVSTNVISSTYLNVLPPEAINTKTLCETIQAEISRLRINQLPFAKKIVHRTQGTFNNILKNPIPWDRLGRKGRIPYIRMFNWLKLTDEHRLTYFTRLFSIIFSI